MNKQNVRKLLSHLKRQQKSKAAARFNMRYFGSKMSVYFEEVLDVPVCNTQACLAGEAVLSLKGGFINRILGGGIQLYKKFNNLGLDIEDTAIKLLNLSRTEAIRLFYFESMGFGYGWPYEFYVAYKQAETPAERLGVAIRRVQHFLDTDGME